MWTLAAGLFLVAVSYGAATTVPPVTTTVEATTAGVNIDVNGAMIYYDFAHNTAMIVLSDGCYEYHMNHQDELDAENEATRLILEATILAELSMATRVQEMGHNHINHMTNEIKNACATLPVYSWD